MSYKNFSYQQTTKVHFGEYNPATLVEELSSYKMVGIVCSRESDIVKRIASDLSEKGVAFTVVTGCMPNPRHDYIDEAASKLQSVNCDFVLGIGGGSVIDASKAISLRIKNNHVSSIWELVTYQSEVQTPALPIGLVVTIASTGSDSNCSFVLSNDEVQEKLIFTHSYVQPKFCFNDPKMTYTLNTWHTACGVADMFSHLMEQYLHNDNDVAVSDYMILGVMRAVAEYGEVAVKQPDNYDARANLLWASSIAMNPILGAGHDANWISHYIEHAFSAKYDVTHGAGMAIVLVNYMKHFASEDQKNRLSMVGKLVFDLIDASSEQVISAIAEFFTRLGLPLQIRDLVKEEISQSQIDEMVEKSMPYGDFVVPGLGAFTKEDARELIEACI